MDDRTRPAEGATTPKLRTHKIRLEVLAGPDQGRVAELPGPEARVGSGRECELVLQDPTVSRRHLLVRIEGEAIRVTDENSRNGTYLDGIRIRDAYARPDSTLTLGDTKLGLRMLEEVIEVPLSNRTSFGGLLGGSAAMRLVFAILERVAPTDATVLIEGETGTGKELVAEALHDESNRASGPFQVLDCSAISASLIEDELFGHVRGAFTGALSDRAGAFELADGGTLFIDEIGELPLNLQPKLLRALENRKIVPLGASVPRRVDVRVVAATNRTLANEVERGRFRQDLYHRLNIIQVRLPPLRERLEDLPMLVRHIEAELAKKARAKRPPLSDEEIARLAERTWEGNVRQLRNVVEKTHSLGVSMLPPSSTSAPVAAPVAAAAAAPAAVSAAEAAADAAAEPAAEAEAEAPLDSSVGFFPARRQVLEAFERRYLAEALQQANGNVSEAARTIKVSRKFYHRAIKQYGLRGAVEDEDG